jgi:hypothetical protein
MFNRNEYDFALRMIHSLSDVHDNNGCRRCYCRYSDTGHSVDQCTSICIAVEAGKPKLVDETDHPHYMSSPSLKVQLSSAFANYQLVNLLQIPPKVIQPLRQRRMRKHRIPQPPPR